MKTQFGVILWAGDGRPARDLKSFDSFRDANNFCQHHEWVFIDKNGIKWDMDIEEREYNQDKSLDDVIKSCEVMSKNNNGNSLKNEYYKTSDGFFDYYVNRKTGEKKFKLDENDIEVPAKFDDFCR